MKLFPEKIYVVELINSSSLAMEHLVLNTKLSDSLVSMLTNKTFIGQVQGNNFKITPSSGAGYISFCVFFGELHGKEGIIKIRIHNVYKILSSILMLLPIIAVVLTFLQRGAESLIDIIPPMLLGIIFVKFVIIEFSFRIVSKRGLKKLTNILGVSKIR